VIENRLKSTIAQDRAAIGSWVTLTDAAVVELMGLAGYDFALIDIEHASLDYQTVENMIRAAEIVGITPLVRVGQNQENVILRVVESGVHGVVVPHVMDRDSAERAVQYTKYEPRGIRGISSMTRAARWSTVDFGEHVRNANEQTMVIPMIEDREGIDNIEEIVAVDGVDVVLIGPADLARAYGVTSEKNPPIIRDAIEHTVQAARRAGKPLGMPIYHPAFTRSYKELVEMGVRFITYSTDAVVLLKAWKENLQKARES
jgi:2-keto-3-deoxy-L-rhamnonate aldolase RhmA